MCSKLQFKESVFRPGDRIQVNSAMKLDGAGQWTGFIRSDAEEKTKRFWVQKGFTAKLDVPATRFAEKSRKTDGDVFDDVGDGNVVFAVGNRKTGEVKVLTRNASPAEAERFGHDRMPVTGRRRFK